MIYILYKHLQKKYIYAFYRYVFSLHECLQNRRFDVEIINNLTNKVDYNNDLFILFDYYLQEIDISKLKKKIYISSETITDRNENVNLDKIKNVIINNDFSLIFSKNYKNTNLLAQMVNTSIYQVPLIHSNFLEKNYEINKSNDVKKTIDVLFYGYISPRRKRLRNRLISKGLIVKFVNLYDHVELIKLIQKSKIVLVIHMIDDNNFFDTYRINLLLSNKCFIIHESIQEEYFINYQNLQLLNKNYKELKKNIQNINEMNNLHKYIVFCNYNEIVEKCLYYLNNDNTDFVNNTYNWIKKYHTMDKYIPYDEIFMLL